MSTGRSRLLELLRDHSAASQIMQTPEADLGVADVEPFPFLAIVGQEEMKLALMLAVINPFVGGVLLIGSRGTAKTTAVRSLTDLLPQRRRSLCPQGCTEERLEELGLDGICDDCARRFGHGQPLTVLERVRLVELPLNARLDDVVGQINERLALEQQRLRLERGILAQADGNILYIDEVNLLDDPVSDAILDAAAQGFYLVRRGSHNLRYRSQFLLIGSMNPEEGELRPQIMDRFGLRVVVRGLTDTALRYQAYEQALRYRRSPEELAAAYATQTMTLAEEIGQARQRLPAVMVSPSAREMALALIDALQIDSNRAEITLFEAARAYAAADERETVTVADIQAVALLALRLRQSAAASSFFGVLSREDERMKALLQQVGLDASHVMLNDETDGKAASEG
jgi:magnesium chelatase subunit I